MADVFISYHEHSAGTLARRIVGALEHEHISCFFAPRDTKPGSFVNSLLEALEQCKIFLLILDEGSNRFGYTYIETVEAFTLYADRSFPILVPFKVGNFKIFRNLHFYLRPFHILNGGDGNSPDMPNISELIVIQLKKRLQ